MSAPACGLFALLLASALVSTVTCWITFGQRFPTAAARAHVQDGTTVEWTYQPNETRHGRLGKGEFVVHDLENIGDHEMVFVTVEFKDSANTPMALPSGVTPQ
jgi:hypothetical protein